MSSFNERRKAALLARQPALPTIPDDVAERFRLGFEEHLPADMAERYEAALHTIRRQMRERHLAEMGGVPDPRGEE